MGNRLHQNRKRAEGNPTGDRAAIARLIRQQIVRGGIRPSDRLPTRDELVARFRVSKHTVQAALTQLLAEGFVEPRAKAGTFVAQCPPHLFHYGLVFSFQLARSRFYEALHDAAREIATEQGCRFVEYNQERAGDLLRLHDDSGEHRLAGSIFVHPHRDVWQSPAMTEPGAPRVLIQSGTSAPIPDLHVDMESFFLRALDYLASRGHRRLSVVFADVTWGDWDAQRLQREATARGLDLAPYALVPVGAGTEARHIALMTRMMMEMDAAKRPQAMIIGDDNHVPAVAAGLMSSGVKVGPARDLEIVSHANYPLSHNVSPLPIRHLGFDCRTLLRQAIDVLKAQRDGRTGTVRLLAAKRQPALFREEVAGASGGTAKDQPPGAMT